MLTSVIVVAFFVFRLEASIQSNFRATPKEMEASCERLEVYTNIFYLAMYSTDIFDVNPNIDTRYKESSHNIESVPIRPGVCIVCKVIFTYHLSKEIL